MSLLRQVVAIISAVLLCMSAFGTAARADESQHWYSFFTKELSSNVSGNSVDATPQLLDDGWRFDINGSTSWPATATVATALTPSQLSWWPAAPAYDPVLGTFTKSASVGSMLTSVSGSPSLREVASLGFTGFRSLEGGRSIPAGAEVTRSFHVEATTTMAARQLLIPVYLSTYGGPVSVVSFDCPGAEIFDTVAQWRLVEPVAGSRLEGNCSLTLRNTTATPALFMPGLSITAIQGIQRLDIAGATSFAATSSPLGAVTLEVAAPAGVTPFGHLDQWEEHRAWFMSENRVALEYWNASYARVYSTSTAADAFAEGALPLHPSWSFSVTTPGAWPSEIAVSTPRDASLFTAFPSTPPVTSGGTTRYTWSGNGPFFTSSLSSRSDFTVASDLGFSADRSLVGGRLVPAGATQSRELRVHVRTTVPMIGLTIDVGTDAFVPPGLPAPPVRATGVSCPGSDAVLGSTDRAWRIDSPTAATERTFSCTFDVTNSGSYDALYMPAVLLWSSRSFVQVAQGLSPELTVPVDDLGSADFTVTPPADTTAQGTASLIDIRIGSLANEDRFMARATHLEVLTAGTFAFGFEPTLEARLTDTATAAPLANKTVRFELTGTGGSSTVATATTDAAGIAHLTLGTSPLPGTYAIASSFAGAEPYLASAASGGFTIADSAGTITGSARLAAGGRAVFGIRSHGSTIAGTLEYGDALGRYVATDVRAIGLSTDGTQAAILVADRAGTLALVRLAGEPAVNGMTIADRVSITIGGVERNPTRLVAEGSIRISP